MSSTLASNAKQGEPDMQNPYDKHQNPWLYSKWEQRYGGGCYQPTYCTPCQPVVCYDPCYNPCYDPCAPKRRKRNHGCAPRRRRRRRSCGWS